MSKELALNETALASTAEGDFEGKAFFENGRGISVIRHKGSYGNQAGLFEVAVIKGTSRDDWDFDFSTELARDVVGWQTPADVVAFARKIAQLPAVTGELENTVVHSLESDV
jgi:hypothetical protein